MYDVDDGRFQLRLSTVRSLAYAKLYDVALSNQWRIVEHHRRHGMKHLNHCQSLVLLGNLVFNEFQLLWAESCFAAWIRRG